MITTIEEAAEAVGVLAKAITELETVAKGQGELLKAQDRGIRELRKVVGEQHLRIGALTSLLDSHHETLIKAGLAPPRPPKGNQFAN